MQTITTVSTTIRITYTTIITVPGTITTYTTIIMTEKPHNIVIICKKVLLLGQHRDLNLEFQMLVALRVITTSE